MITKILEKKLIGEVAEDHFAPEITIRAGGEKGRTAAIVPCCQTLGPPNEEKSILGHLDKENSRIYITEVNGTN